MHSDKLKNRSIFLFIAFLSILLLRSPLHAFNKSVILSPTRIVMEGRERAAILKLINPNDTTNTYKIGLVFIRMDEMGMRKEVEIPNDEELAVQKMIRFSPRRATVGPKEWQTVRLMVRKPAGLAPGEYRIHLKVAPVPDPLLPGDREGKESGKMSVHLDVVFNITIPIIIRHGQGFVKIVPQKPVLKKWEKRDGYYLETKLLRQGSHSAYCNLIAYHTPQGQSARQKIGEIKGLSFYTPNLEQKIRIPVDPGALTPLSRGILDLDIQDLEDNARPLIGSGHFILE